MRIEYHRTLVADAPRNEAFYKALKTTIVPGKSIVADIGCGTGLLGFMAAKLGAKRVFLLEAGEIVSVARKLARHNGLKNIEIVPAHSTEVTPPEKVDIVVSETLGNYALEENIIDTLNDAKTRYLKPGGIMIPDQIVQYVAPVTTSRFWDELTVWKNVGFDLDFAPAQTTSLNNIYVRKIAARDTLNNGQSAEAWDRIDLTAKPSSNRQGTARWTATAATKIFGLSLWWDARLNGNHNLSTAPSAKMTHWEQLYLPVEEPMELQRGETLDAKLKSKSSYERGTDVAWTLSILTGSGKVKATQTMDLKRGYIA
ncbi:MAG: hypothetical protein RL291_1943 [Pseudomonadota bacterium]